MIKRVLCNLSVRPVMVNGYLLDKMINDKLFIND